MSRPRKEMAIRHNAGCCTLLGLTQHGSNDSCLRCSVYSHGLLDVQSPIRKLTREAQIENPFS